VEVAANLEEQVRAGAILEGRFEEPFGRGQRIPPVVIDIKDGDGTAKAYIEGKIDRVDFLPGDRVKIIDYKTGDEKFSVNEAEKGYRLQLMLYLEAALGGEKKPAGVFYFHITEPMINMTGERDPENDPDGAEKLKKEITKGFRMNGVLVDDPEVIRSVAGDFEGFSDIVSLRKTKDGIVGTSSDKILSEEDFEAMREKVAETVAEKTAELLRGRVAINPMKTGERSACAFCTYKGICRFDTIFEGNKWNPVD
jgi:ATP-dependent helicase/nuclease subunit B